MPSMPTYTVTIVAPSTDLDAAALAEITDGLNNNAVTAYDGAELRTVLLIDAPGVLDAGINAGRIYQDAGGPRAQSITTEAA